MDSAIAIGGGGRARRPHPLWLNSTHRARVRDGGLRACGQHLPSIFDRGGPEKQKQIEFSFNFSTKV